MIFICLGRFKEKPTKEMIARGEERHKKMSAMGIRPISQYWTLGRFDSVWIFEAPDEKTAMKMMVAVEGVKTETLVAVSRDEAIKFIQ